MALGPELDPDKATGRPLRRKLYRLRDNLRGFQLARQRDCGTRRIVAGGPVVQLADRRASLRGVLRCGSVHTCPTCRLTIAGTRGDEVSRAVAWHGHERTRMLSLTVRHALSHHLIDVRRGVADAWRLFTSGAPWLRKRAEWGLAGTIRALEVTVGANGWHPHLHVLVFVQNPDDFDASIQWIRERWHDAVVRALGGEHAPDLKHGAIVSTCDAKASNYVTKLGLELSDGGTKRGRAGSRSVWQLAQHVARLRDAQAADEPDVERWRTYAREIKGARQLTWSRGLKKAAGILERTDQEIVDQDPLSVVVTAIDAQTWDMVKRVRGVTVALLEAAESHGHNGVLRVVERAIVMAAKRRADLFRHRHATPPDAADASGGA